MSPNKKRHGASRIKKEDGEDMLVENVFQLTKGVCDLVAGQQSRNRNALMANCWTIILSNNIWWETTTVCSSNKEHLGCSIVHKNIRYKNKKKHIQRPSATKQTRTLNIAGIIQVHLFNHLNLKVKKKHINDSEIISSEGIESTKSKPEYSKITQ